MNGHERRSRFSFGLSNMKHVFVCVLFVLSIVLCSAARAPPSTSFDTHESKSRIRSSPNFQPSFNLPHPPTGQFDAGRFGVDKRRVPTGSNPLHNRFLLPIATQ